MHHALRLLVLLAVAVVAGIAAAQEATAEPVILLTAFKPFAGRGVNGSETIAQALDQRVIAGARIHVLVLPVQWGEPEKRVPEAVASLKPVLLLGLGEGYPGHVAVESLAHNRAAHPDEAGTVPPATLDAAGPATRAGRLRFDASWFVGTALPVLASEDAGDYLCNDLFYTALAQPIARAGFVHLPPQGEAAAERYAAVLAPIVVTFIERNLAVADAKR